jgi:hypothetical protein
VRPDSRYATVVRGDHRRDRRQPPASGDHRALECANRRADRRLAKVVHDAAGDRAVPEEPNAEVDLSFPVGERHRLHRPARPHAADAAGGVPGLLSQDRECAAWEVPEHEATGLAGEHARYGGPRRRCRAALRRPRRAGHDGRPATATNRNNRAGYWLIRARVDHTSGEDRCA